jgi:hypothetical protein
MATSLYARSTAERLAKQKPTSIGYYDMEKSVGEGNFAKVKLATHCLTGEKVRCSRVNLTSLGPTLSLIFQINIIYINIYHKTFAYFIILISILYIKISCKGGNQDY